MLIGSSNDSFPWKRFASTHLAIRREYQVPGFTLGFYVQTFRDVAQLVARTAGGREVASSSLVIPTITALLEPTPAKAQASESVRVFPLVGSVSAREPALLPSTASPHWRGASTRCAGRLSCSTSNGSFSKSGESGTLV